MKTFPIIACRYRVDEWNKKMARWNIATVTYRDNDKSRRLLSRLLSENKQDEIETRVFDLVEECFLEASS